MIANDILGESPISQASNWRREEVHM